MQDIFHRGLVQASSNLFTSDGASLLESFAMIVAKSVHLDRNEMGWILSGEKSN